jgi:anti-sigma factor RsiW
MNCDQIEELLPRLCEGDVTESERAAAAAHMERCARCRDAHARFAALERLLVARRDESPPPRRIADAVMGRLGARRPRMRVVPRWFVPALAAVVVFAVLAPALARLGAPAGVIEGISGWLASIVALCASIPRWIVEAAGSDSRIVLAVYLALTAALAAAGRLIGIRIVQEQ